MPIIPFASQQPQVPKECFIAPDAWLIGDVQIGADASFFFGAVARGDIKAIRIGAKSNIQEHALLHTSTGLYDCVVGSEVTVGHRAILHGCTVGNRCIIGMGATVLDGARIGNYCLIGAHALIPMHMEIPDKSLVLGVPGKIVRTLEEHELKQFEQSAAHYVTLAQTYHRFFAQAAHHSTHS